MVKRVLAPFGSKLDSVVVFGSRASGRYRSASDLDLALKGTVGAADILALQDAFYESDLAIEVDVLAYDALESESLRRHIDSYGVVLFEAEELKLDARAAA